MLCLQLQRLKEEEQEKVAHSQVVADLLRSEHDDFDDYIEMAIQFGFITMFAGAMPLAAAIGSTYILIETYADLVKLVHLKRRPTVERARNIGVWRTVIQVHSLVDFSAHM